MPGRSTGGSDGPEVAPEQEIWRARGVELLDKAFTLVLEENIPLSTLALDGRNDYVTCRAIELYLGFGEREKGIALIGRYFEKVSEHFYLEGLEQSVTESVSMLYHVLNLAGEGELAEQYLKDVEKIFQE